MFAGMTPDIVNRSLALLDIMPGRPRLYSGRHYGAGHGLFRAKNPPLGASINYWVRGNSREQVKIRIADPSGFVIRELEGASMTGLNRVVWDLQADEKHRFGREDEWLGQTRFVPSGEYTVTVTMGKETAEKTVQVLPAPNED